MKSSSLLLICIYTLIKLWLKIRIVQGIVHGQKANPGHFTYQISLQTNEKHVCGGAIFDDWHVVTAAHCIIDENDAFIDKMFSVVCGVTDLTDYSPYRIKIDVRKAYVPFEFKRTNPNPYYIETGNIAILKLKEKLPFKNNLSISRVHFPKRKRNGEFLKFYNEKVIIAGFGVEAPYRILPDRGHGNVEACDRLCTKLNFADAVVLRQTECKNRWIGYDIADGHLCAQVIQDDVDSPKGVCDGDGGSPLVTKGNMIVGILTNIRNDCNERWFSAVYTRVSSYVGFIKKVLMEEQSPDIRFADYKPGFRVLETIYGRISDLISNPNKTLASLDGRKKRKVTTND